MHGQDHDWRQNTKRQEKGPRLWWFFSHRELGYRFPEGDIHRHLKTHTTSHGQVSATAAGYSDIILENLTTDVLELAGNASKVLKVKHTTPGQLRFAIQGDEELDSLIKTTIAGFSEIPYTSKSLIGKKGGQENCLGNVLASLLFFTVCNRDEGHVTEQLFKIFKNSSMEKHRQFL